MNSRPPRNPASCQISVKVSTFCCWLASTILSMCFAAEPPAPVAVSADPDVSVAADASVSAETNIIPEASVVPEANISAEANTVEAKRGQQIYAETCASCHGNEGQGVADGFDSPLAGDATLSELAELIAGTMPEEDPDSCVGDDAQAVAKYVYDAFYSPAAQPQTKPRIRLARLTANQLRQSLADLYRRFDVTANYTDKLGIRARYFNRDNKKGRVSFDRVDPLLDFDFGLEGPGQGVNAEDYKAHWSGALRIDVSGRYELIVRSTCSFVVFFGDYEREFINNYVQSENRTEFRKTIQLTGGRVYPFKIDFQQRKRKTEQPPARISLSWKTPHGVEQIIPAEQFANLYAPGAFALQAKLPPDDRSYGYERGIALDRQWDASTTAAAIEFADLVNAELWPKYRKKNKGGAGGNRKQLRTFLNELVETAFRGPISDDVRQLYIDDQVDAVEDDSMAIKRVLLIALKSPRFLYPALDNDRKQSQRVANRLSLILHDSLPSDEWLRKQVQHDQMQLPHQVRDAARQMVNDWRTRGKARQLLYEWLNLGHLGEITKDDQKFPGFDQQLVSDLRQSLDAFLDDVVWSERSDFRELLTSSRGYATQGMADYYGAAWTPAGLGPKPDASQPEKAATLEAAPTQTANQETEEEQPSSAKPATKQNPSEQSDEANNENENENENESNNREEEEHNDAAEEDASQPPAEESGKPLPRNDKLMPLADNAPATDETASLRIGVLSHPYLLSGLAYRDSTSPIHRGVFLLRYVLGRTLRPPNEAFTPLSPDLHPDLTTRERVGLQTSPENCQVCHVKINGLGFVLENFDATGRYQLTERGRAIDATGRYTDRTDETQEFRGPADLAAFLADSPDVHRAFVRRAFQHFVKQPPAAYGWDTEDKLLESFTNNQFHIRKLLVEIAMIAATEPRLSEASAKTNSPKTASTKTASTTN